jgi:hypothetical protein
MKRQIALLIPALMLLTLALGCLVRGPESEGRREPRHEEREHERGHEQEHEREHEH